MSPAPPTAVRAVLARVRWANVGRLAAALGVTLAALLGARACGELAAERDDAAGPTLRAPAPPCRVGDRRPRRRSPRRASPERRGADRPRGTALGGTVSSPLAAVDAWAWPNSSDPADTSANQPP